MANFEKIKNYLQEQKELRTQKIKEYNDLVLEKAKLESKIESFGDINSLHKESDEIEDMIQELDEGNKQEVVAETKEVVDEEEIVNNDEFDITKI